MLRIKSNTPPIPKIDTSTAGGSEDVAPEIPKAPPDGTGASDVPDQDEESQEITATDGDKLPQPLVVYMTSDEGPFQCDHCRYFLPENACSKVDGDIDPGGCCNLFNPTVTTAPEDAQQPATDAANQEDSGY